MASLLRKQIDMTVQVCASLETWDSAFFTNTMDPPLGPTSELPHMHLVLL